MPYDPVSFRLIFCGKGRRQSHRNTILYHRVPRCWVPIRVPIVHRPRWSRPSPRHLKQQPISGGDCPRRAKSQSHTEGPGSAACTAPKRRCSQLANLIRALRPYDFFRDLRSFDARKRLIAVEGRWRRQRPFERRGTGAPWIGGCVYLARECVSHTEQKHEQACE